jgi:hypothetical protein
LYLSWSNSSKVKPWFDRIRHASPRPRSFFGLVDPECRSVGAVLAQDDRRFVYPAYQYSSNLIHGSTVDGILQYVEDGVMPFVAATDRKVQKQAGHVRRFCHFNARLLADLQKTI